MIYQLYNNLFGQGGAYYVDEQGRMVSFLFDPANTDYQAFKKAVLEGAQLLDADGNVISADFVKDLA